MINIIDSRGTGKTKKLLEAAQQQNAIIFTSDKRALEVKAKNYGYNNLQIFDFSDLKNDSYPLGYPVFIHNGDKMLKWLLDKYYNIELAGFTATKEGEK